MYLFISRIRVQKISFPTPPAEGLHNILQLETSTIVILLPLSLVCLRDTGYSKKGGQEDIS